MISSRMATRAAARSLRTPIRGARQTRFASTTQTEAAKTGGTSGFAAGVAGGAVVFLAGYGYYYFSGAKTLVNSYSSTKSQFQKATQSLQEKAPEPNQAISWLRNATSSYAAFIPGAQSYLDTAFGDLEDIQKKHGPEVEKIVNKTYGEVKEIGKNGSLDMQTVVKTYNVLQKAVADIGGLAKDSLGDIMDNHPEVKDKVGGNISHLQKMAENYGPDAKKEVDDVMKQVQDIFKGGMGLQAVEKVRKLIQEKSEKVQELGEKAWDKGMKEYAPYLEKNPQVKKIVEGNTDVLKGGNLSEIFEQVKKAVESGKSENLEKYVKDLGQKAKDTAKNSGTGGGIQGQVQQMIKAMPGSDQMWQKIQELQEVAKDHGEEFEELVKGAYGDVEKVLQKRISEAQKLKGKAENDVKKSV